MQLTLELVLIANNVGKTRFFVIDDCMPVLLFLCLYYGVDTFQAFKVFNRSCTVCISILSSSFVAVILFECF